MVITESYLEVKATFPSSIMSAACTDGHMQNKNWTTDISVEGDPHRRFIGSETTDTLKIPGHSHIKHATLTN